MPEPRIADPIAMLSEHLERLTPMTLELSPGVTFALIGTLQLALRHPGNNGPTSQLMRGLCDDLIKSLAHGDETIETILRLGDNPAFDHPAATPSSP